MKMKILSAIMFLSVFLSCKRDYDFGIDSKPKPIVNCLFHPDSIWKIELTSTPSSIWVYQFVPIEGAIVRISTKSHSPVEMDRFVGRDLGFYTSTTENVSAEPLETVSLEIITAGDTVSATSYIPPKPVYSLEIKELVTKGSKHEPKNGLFNYGVKGIISMKFDTRKTGHVYYAIKLRYRTNMVYGSPYYMAPNDPDITIYDFLQLRIQYPGAFKTLRRTDGYCLDLSAYVPESDELNFTISGSVDNLMKKPDFIVLTVTSITEEYLKYNKKIIDQYVAGQDVFSEPVSVYSNINGGLGIFSGINSVTDTIWIH